MLFLPPELFYEKKNVAAHQLPPTLSSQECLGIYHMLPFVQLDLEYKNSHYSEKIYIFIILHKPNSDFKHTHVPLCDFW